MNLRAIVEGLEALTQIVTQGKKPSGHFREYCPGCGTVVGQCKCMHAAHEDVSVETRLSPGLCQRCAVEWGHEGDPKMPSPDDPTKMQIPDVYHPGTENGPYG